MRRFLILLILCECVVLVGGAAFVGLSGNRLKKAGPVAPAFRPPIYDAVIGDSVRYRRVDAGDEARDLGYVDYTVRHARILQNSGVGVEFNLEVTERDAEGAEQRRLIRVQPRLLDHGFLPQTFAELSMLDVPGGRPIIRSIRTAEVPGPAPETTAPGFLIETVVPREGLAKVSSRIYLRPDVPVFGVVRWERGDETWILHRSHRAERRDPGEGPE